MNVKGENYAVDGDTLNVLPNRGGEDDPPLAEEHRPLDHKMMSRQKWVPPKGTLPDGSMMDGAQSVRCNKHTPSQPPSFLGRLATPFKRGIYSATGFEVRGFGWQVSKGDLPYMLTIAYFSG